MWDGVWSRGSSSCCSIELPQGDAVRLLAIPVLCRARWKGPFWAPWHTLHFCYATLLCMTGNFTQGNIFHHGAKRLAEILSRSRLTQSNKTYLTVAALVWKWISTYVTPVENTALITCRPFLLVPQERVRVTALQESLRQNSYPIRRQGWLKIAPREQAWERDGPK